MKHGEKAADAGMRQNTLLRSILRPFVVLLGLMLLLGMMEYMYSYNFAMQSTVETHEVALKNIAQQMDNMIQSLDSLATTINDTPTLAQMIRKAREHPAYYMSEVIRSLPSLQGYDNLVEDYFLYIEASGHIYAQRQGYIRPSLYYGAFIGNEWQNYEEWREEILDSSNFDRLQPAQYVYLSGERVRALTYSRPYVYNARNQSLGKIIFYIRADGIRELFASAFDAGAELVYLLDPDGRLLISFAADAGVEEIPAEYILEAAGAGEPAQARHRVNGRELLYSRISLANHLGTAVIATRTSVLTQKAVQSLAVLLAAVVIVLLAAALMVTRYLGMVRQPLARLSRNLTSGEDDHPFARLDEQIDRITDDNELLAEQLLAHREALFESIVSDGGAENDQLYSLISEGVDLDEGALSFIGIYMQLSDAASPRVEELCKGVFRECSAGGDCVRLLSRRNDCAFAVLYMTGGSPDRRAVEELLGQIAAELLRRCGLKARFFAGQPCGALKRVCYSFSQAWTLLNSQHAQEDIVVAEPSLKSRYSFSLADENALRASCQEGDEAAVTARVEELFRRNFVDCSAPSRTMQTLLYVRLLDVLMNCSNGECFGMDLERLADLQPDDAQRAFRGAFARCAQLNGQKNTVDTNELNQQIVEYIHQNYCDPGICLAGIASAFGMTESYLSVLFKRVLGQNYSAYLEKLRIDRANELLRGDQCSIGDIAVMVGYDHVTSFRRAYKRIMGCTPSVYQSQWREQNGDQEEER